MGSTMHVGMGLIKNERGNYHVPRRVPKGRQDATARVMSASKERVSIFHALLEEALDSLEG